eukprot:946497-Amphidinium_carterae.1
MAGLSLRCLQPWQRRHSTDYGKNFVSVALFRSLKTVSHTLSGLSAPLVLYSNMQLQTKLHSTHNTPFETTTTTTATTTTIPTPS